MWVLTRAGLTAHLRSPACACACAKPHVWPDVADCQRCSEVLRDHIMRQKPNSALCTRAQPCDDCKKVLEHFALSGDALWAKFDERAQQNRLKRAALSVDGADMEPPAKVLRRSCLPQDVDDDAASDPANGSAQERVKALGRASVSMPGALYHAPGGSETADRAAADLTHAQRKNEFAALLASLHNQPFDATRAGIASRAVSPVKTGHPTAGMRPLGPNTHSRGPPPAGSSLHSQLLLHPQLRPVLANRPLSDPGDDPELTNYGSL